MNFQFDSGLMWFRRDLRTSDNAALALALRSCSRLHCVFLFDEDLLNHLPRRDRRVKFIHDSLIELDEQLQRLTNSPDAGLIVLKGRANDVLVKLAVELGVQAVFAATDYEPLALKRDDEVREALSTRGIALQTCKDHVIFEQREILTNSGTPYTVFTPYKRKWLASLSQDDLRSHTLNPKAQQLARKPLHLRQPMASLEALGFETTDLHALKLPTGTSGAQQLFEEFFTRMDEYHDTRDFPALIGPSHLGIHLRFGTISIRQLASIAWQRELQGSRGAATWLGELIWRDFYFQILANFPHVATGAFKPEYDAIRWECGERAQELFQAWCEGKTGYPLVDAAMRQINQTGYMHNRLRMVAGSFLVKDLGVDWRWGEQYFARQLNDFDLAANNGGWQWVSSSGCDAQPYFRIFNPVSQSQKFDSDGTFIRRYLPQLAKLPNKALHAPWAAKPDVLTSAGVQLGHNYPMPIVTHEEARLQTLQRYAVIRKSPPSD